ncbi:Serine/threonine-protein kinase [Hibiscus syriacus]|uniref:Serine/threonine-protein kinase n=1 Tax=Hibiscus syriacus TaxID=106335 RepID=A0A6A2ZGU8_HIBSY|nr:Serine/threonine-protein kinase [Hibiscus syriacus]
MGTNRKRRIKALEPHSEINVQGCKGVDKSRKIDLGKTEKNEQASPSGLGDPVSSKSKTTTTGFVEEITTPPALDLNTEERLHPFTKIKLQLFPIDESTCLGLEKDGFHSYLELTLSARKKISSVLKHIDTKWGRSSIAVGEPMLFPYLAENLTSYRWTRNDICISARDVYATIGSPSVFRLSLLYLLRSKASSELVDAQKSCNTYMQNTYEKGVKAEITSEESGTSGETNEAVTEKMSNGVGSMLLEEMDSLADKTFTHKKRLLTGSLQPPPTFVAGANGESVPNELYDDFVAQDSALASWLLSTISSHMLSQFVGAETAMAAWNKVLQFFANRSTTAVISLHYKLQSLRKGDDSMRTYLTRIKEIAGFNARDDQFPMSAHVTNMSNNSKSSNASSYNRTDYRNYSGYAARGRGRSSGRGSAGNNTGHVNYSSVEGKLLVGNGVPLSIHATGKSALCSNSRALMLNDLLHVPKITKNLLYVSKLARDNDVYFEFRATNACTRNTGLYLLKNKSQTVHAFQLFQQLVSTQFDSKIQVVQSDWGGEFCSLSRVLLAADTEPKQVPEQLPSKIDRGKTRKYRQCDILDSYPGRVWVEGVTVEAGCLKVSYEPAGFQLADGFTKPLTKAPFQVFRDRLHVCPC